MRQMYSRTDSFDGRYPPSAHGDGQPMRAGREAPETGSYRQPADPRLTDTIGSILFRQDFAGRHASAEPPEFPSSAPRQFRAAEEQQNQPPAARISAKSQNRPNRLRLRYWLVGALAIAAVATVGLWGFGTQPQVASAHISLEMNDIADRGERLALLNARLSAVTGLDVLSKTVEKLRLDYDPEFAAGTATSWGVLTELLTSSPEADFERGTEARLRSAVDAVVDPSDESIVVTVRSSDEQKSAAIAGAVAETFVEAVNAERPVRKVDAAAGPDVDAERVALEKAQAELQAFIAGGGEKLQAAIKLKTDVDKLRLENALAQKRLNDEGGKTVSGNLSSLLDGSFPAALLTPALEDLRGRYVSAKIALEQLAVAFGPRHPRLQTAQTMVDTLKSDIERELRNAFAEGRASLQQAQAKARQLAAQSAEATKKLEGTGIDLARYEALQASVEAAQETFRTALAQNDGTGSVDPLVTASIATPAVSLPQIGAQAQSDSRLGELLFAILLVLAVAACGLAMLHIRRQSHVADDDLVEEEPSDRHHAYHAAAERDYPEEMDPWPQQSEDHVAGRRAHVHFDPDYPGEFDTAGHAAYRQPSLLAELRRVAPTMFRDEDGQQDIRQIKQEVAALRQRVQDWADRRGGR